MRTARTLARDQTTLSRLLQNLVLGSLVALKLKKLRRSLTGPQALSTAYHNALAAAPADEQGLDGLNAKGARRLFSNLGVHFNKLQLQAVYLEIDGERKGLLTEAQLLNWYSTEPARHQSRNLLPPCMHACPACVAHTLPSPPPAVDACHGRYHGHIGRQLKKIANAKPPRGSARTLQQWLCVWPDTACDLSVYAPPPPR